MNKTYKIVEVDDRKTEKEFLYLPVKLYKNDENWIRPLDKDIEEVFDRKVNKYFRDGDCIRWILLDADDKTIGRVAAFVDYKGSLKNTQPTGGMGFFECINDQKAAFLLFDQCKKWLEKKGMKAMDGPVNFGDRDRWWGVLVDGFVEPNYCIPYNFPYYKDLFEAYGFQNYFNQYTYYRLIREAKEGLSPAIIERAERILKNPRYTFKHLDLKDVDKYTEDFRTVYNKGWANFAGVKEISEAHAKALMKTMKPIIDEKLMWFAYFDDQPVAFFLMVPELNQYFKYVNGKMNFAGTMKFLYHKWMHHCTKACGIVFGVVPEHHGKGVEAAIIMAFSKVAFDSNFQYKYLEFNWIGDFNPTMMRLLGQVGAKIVKTHVTYRYMFDPSLPFKRAAHVS